MKPADRERLAAMLRERGYEAQWSGHRSLFIGARLFIVEADVGGERVRWAQGREVGTFTGRGWLPRLVDDVCRELGLEAR